MQKRKGFTLVELVIVIAVIAILAGVLIGTFASVINRANDSARLQELKAQEIEQKANDIIKKIEDSNWLGWEDYEADIVTKLTKVYKENQAANITSDEVKNAVSDVVTTALANKKVGTSDLTEEQVKAIIENALGTVKFEGVTEAQVKAALKEALGSDLYSTLTLAQVREVVETANAKNLTAADLAKAVASCATIEQVNAALSSATSNLATAEQAEAIKNQLDELVLKTTETDNVVLAKSLNIKLTQKGITSANYPYEVVSVLGGDDAVVSTDTTSTILLSLVGSKPTFVVVKDSTVLYDGGITVTANDYKLWIFQGTVDDTYSTYLTATLASVEPNGVGLDVGVQTITSISYTYDNATNAESGRNVVIRTNSAKTTLTINASNDTVNHYDSVGKVDAQKVDLYHCYNEYGTAAYIKLTEGKVVAKAGGKIAVVFANNTDSGKVAVAKEDNATIEKALTTVEAVDTANFAAHNLHLEYSADGINPYTAEQIEATGELSVASETGVQPQGMDYTAVVNLVGYNSLSDAISAANAGDTVSLLKDVTITKTDAMGDVSFYWKNQPANKTRPAGRRYATVGLIIEKSLNINGNGHSITTTTKDSTKGDFAGVSLAITESNVKVVLKDLSMITTEMSSIYVGENVSGLDLTIDGCSLKADSYTIKTCNGADNGNITIKNSRLEGWAAVNARGNNCKFFVTNSDLSGENTASQSSSNNYASFVIDGDVANDSTTVSGTYGSNNTVSIVNTKISATSASANNQTWLSIQYGAKNNSVTVDSSSILTNPSVWTYSNAAEGATNTVNVAGTNYNGTLDE